MLRQCFGRSIGDSVQVRVILPFQGAVRNLLVPQHAYLLCLEGGHRFSEFVARRFKAQLALAFVVMPPHFQFVLVHLDLQLDQRTHFRYGRAAGNCVFNDGLLPNRLQRLRGWQRGGARHGRSFNKFWLLEYRAHVYNPCVREKSASSRRSRRAMRSRVSIRSASAAQARTTAECKSQTITAATPMPFVVLFTVFPPKRVSDG